MLCQAPVWCFCFIQISIIFKLVMHIQFVLQTVPEAREESDHELCPPPKVVTSNVQNTTTELKAFFIYFLSS